MAYWQRKNRNKVYIYTSKGGNKKQVSRSEYTFLDSYTDSQVDQWVREWALKYENKQVGPRNLLYSSSPLADLVRQFTDYRQSRGLDRKTARYHRRLLTGYVLSYYLRQDPPIPEPKDWAPSAPRLLAYLEKRGLGSGAISHLNIAFRRFWDWLQEEGLVLPGTVLKLRNPHTPAKLTPLKSVLSPDDILLIADSLPEVSLQLITLLGYFFSLRPLEIFALRPRDFRAGEWAAQLEACAVFRKKGLYSRFAVYVNEARKPNGEFGPLKTKSSQAWVACFDERAARRIVLLLADRPENELLIPRYLPDWWMRFWRKITGFQVKDLRRASLYWLGHGPLPEPIALKNHARHAKLETTALYCRRPDEGPTKGLPLSLDLDK